MLDFLKGSEKITVEVIDATGVSKKRKFARDQHKIIVRPGSKGRGHVEETATFSEKDFILYYVGFWPFRRLKRKLILKEKAPSCICLASETPVIPAYTNREARAYADATVVKKSGETAQKIEVPLIVYLILGLTVVLQFITLLSVSGRVRI